MRNVRTITLDYGDARFSVYLIELPEECKEPGPDWVPGPVMHSHFYYELHYVTRGQCLYRLDGKELLLREGQMLLLPPETIHGSVDPASDTHERRVISLSLSAGEPAGRFHAFFRSALEELACVPMQAPANFGEYVDILQQKELYDCVPGFCRLKAAAADLVSDLFQLQPLRGPEMPVPPEPPCDAEVAILLENMVNRPDISLERIAAVINYSTRHTARLIKSIYGASLSEIRRSRKNK